MTCLRKLSVYFNSLWICFISLHFGTASQQTVEQKVWVVDRAFDDRVVATQSFDPSSPCLYDLVTSGSKRQCAVACGRQWWCRSFFFNQATEQCRLHSRLFDSPNDYTTDSDPGARYFKAPTDSPCPSWMGYSRDCYSGLCYKIHMVDLDWQASRAVCVAEGADLITLDTVHKTQGIMDILMTDPNLVREFYHVGAARPWSEWDTPWTSSSSFYIWVTTSQSLVPLYQTGLFTQGEPSYEAAENCVDLGTLLMNYDNFTHFGAFADGYCSYTCRFICEI